MRRLVGALLAGLLLRCPRCWQGRLFQRGFSMNTHCPRCGLPFETASGEMTGGMGINIAVTLLILMAAALTLGLNRDVPLLPLLAGLSAVAVLFPIAFYRSARGMWVAILALTGDNSEAD